MNQTNWEKVEKIFHAACDLSSEKRKAFLESECAGDHELRKEVEALVYYAQDDYILSNDHHLHLGLEILDKEKQQSLIGKKFGRYEIIKQLGQGGMGAVYQAVDPSLNRLVALKLLTNLVIENDENINRFQVEALTASSISHPNIAHIYESGHENKQHYIAMEFVEGITLRDLLREKQVDILTALDIVLQTANALASAHQTGIIHRDIKPENIMIRSDGYVKVLDFGIAKLAESNDSDLNFKSGKSFTPLPIRNLHSTKRGLILGTIGYISFEQLSSKNVDLRTDIWSLGVVLYEVLSGNKPFKEKTVEEIRREILRNSPPQIYFPDLSSNNEAHLQKILAQMLDKDRDKRYTSANELADDLKHLKHSLEFDRQFFTSENTAKAAAQTDYNAIRQTQNSSFIKKSQQLWRQQRLLYKALAIVTVIGFFTFAFGVSAQYFSFFDLFQVTTPTSFSPDLRHRLQISTLYGVRKKLQSAIPFISFAPDGNSFSFVMSGEETNDIYIKQLNQSEPKRLTDGKWIYQTPVWSPDGLQIAFVSNRDNTNAIWTISPSGGVPALKRNLDINFASCQLLKWSNDARRLFFQSGKTLKTIELDSGRIEEIKFPLENIGTSFNISADESLVSFVTLSEEKPKLWGYNLTTKQLTEIASEKNFNFSSAILTGNNRVVYSSNQNGNSQLYIADLIDKKSSQITFGDSNAYSPVVSPDGTRIVYISENNTANIFSIDLNSKKELRLTEATKMQLFPVQSKGSRNLIFQVADEYSNFTQSPFKFKNLDTNEEQTINGSIGFWAKWSPLGNEIAYMRYQGREFNIWKTGFSDYQTKQLTTGGILTGGYTTAPFNMLSTPFNWSPDGQKIIFISKQSGAENIWSINSDGANQQKLTVNTDPKISYNSAIWSPDGKNIGFNRRTQIEPNKFRYDISVFSNNNVRELFHSDQKLRLLGWDADSTNLLVAVENLAETEIYTLSEKATPKLLTKLAKCEFPSLVLSPEGRSIAFSAVRNGVYNIYSYSVNGKEKQITENKEDMILFSGISWSPAGDRLFYSKQSGGIQISMISDNSE